jgi:hypothetical protein
MDTLFFGIGYPRIPVDGGVADQLIRVSMGAYARAFISSCPQSLERCPETRWNECPERSWNLQARIPAQ